MHRVDADDYITVGGKRRFVDRSLPTYEGTVDGAYWNNAIQEEICTVIENAGLTLRSSGAADESAGWDQLYDAIFNSGAISNAALAANLSLDKFASGDLDVGLANIDTALGILELDNIGLTKKVSVSASGIKFYGSDIPGEERTVLSLQYNVRGWMASASHNDASTGVEDGHSHITGGTYTNASGFALNIPVTANIFGATLSYVESTTGTLVDNVPVKIKSNNDGSGNREITTIEIWGIGRTVSNYDPDLSEIVWLNVLADL